MNRTIFYRGKYSPQHGWVYGHYYNNCDFGANMDVIIYLDDNLQAIESQINTKFLGQFIGLTDKNKKQIFEGDILQYTEHKSYLMSSCKMLICWSNEYAGFGYRAVSKNGAFVSFWNHDELENDILNHCEVIGNIHEHQELIKK